MEQPSNNLEVDVHTLMEKRLPTYIMNHLQAAGYDDLKVIASMDFAEGKKSSYISKIEDFIERRHNR